MNKNILASLPLDKLQNRNILITGASGLIGGALVDVLLSYPTGAHVYAMVRNTNKAEARFNQYIGRPDFHILEGDINNPLPCDIVFHYIIHAASNANPNAYSIDPVGTLWTTLNGTHNLLEYGREHSIERFLFVSSGEIYGNGENTIWKENESGNIDTMSVRSCYPSSKRAAETMCVSYAEQYQLNIVVARPCHTYGPHFIDNDNRAFAQFARKARNHENIVLKSSGEQYRSWIYVVDCAVAILTILLCGENRQAYNIADINSHITIKNLAELTASIAGTQVVYDIPNSTEKKGYSEMKRAIFDTSKLEALGWKARFTLEAGLRCTIQDELGL